MDRRLHLVGVAVALGLAWQRAAAQVTWHATAAAGPADRRAGGVGHLGIRVAPGGQGAWAQLRADATAGRLAGRPARAGTVAVEVGPPERRTQGGRVFGLLGVTAVRTGPTPGADRGLMAGAGGRVRLGRVWLSAEQRFQPGFSPFLLGLSL
jgi:hypothetical protein